MVSALENLEGVGKLNYEEVRRVAQRTLSNDDPDTARPEADVPGDNRIAQLTEWNEILLDWTLEYVEMIRYVRRDDIFLTPKLQRVKEWVVLQDGIRRALALRQPIDARGSITCRTKTVRFSKRVVLEWVTAASSERPVFLDYT